MRRLCKDECEGSLSGFRISLQRPSSPFGVTWHLLSFSEDAAKVSANAAYRNPSGFLGICPKVEKGGQGVAVYRQVRDVSQRVPWALKFWLGRGV